MSSIYVNMSFTGRIALADLAVLATILKSDSEYADVQVTEKQRYMGESVASEIPSGNVAASSITTLNTSPTVSEAPASTSENAPDSDEIDIDGHPWSAELHASTRSTTKDGRWRMKVGVTRPDPLPGFPKGETPSSTSTLSQASPVADGATVQAGSSQTVEPASAAALQDDEDEFAAFRTAAANAEAADAAAAANVPARVWTDADLGALCNQAAVKLGDPAPVKEAIVKFVPAGEVAHSRNVPADKRAEFVAAVEAAAGIQFAG